MSRWVPSCYVMCLTGQRDVYCEHMSRIMLCNVFDCAEMCAVSRSVPSCSVMCLTVQRNVCCEQIIPIMLYSVFDCREMCAVSRWVPSCYVMCLTVQRCVLWADECHHAMECVWLQRDEFCEQMSPDMLCNVFDCAERCVLWADQSNHPMSCVIV